MEKLTGAELEKAFRDIDIRGSRSKYWSQVDEIIKWLESLEEYEKCIDLVEMKKNLSK